ncbi:amidase family protein [Oceanirhabdus sp. W0125-5]|uniref:amidase family protein n=1 Tax=Oceanirhabdus sp. W0125-5 TaxID=2999116 RepID=UPI0022F2B834|nr:amidase family protein [Oceanirhabdus sp. W0125-5]WBW96279.1 amidase family protein [Oceanirhabdus sp. W0125-5]
MKKKILLGILAGIGVFVAAGGIFVVNFLRGFDQIRLQHTKEVISPLKRKLDFSPYESELSKISDSRMEELNNLIFEKSIDEIQNSIRNGQLSCQEVVLYYISRIKEYDHKYNTVIQLNPKALEYAKSLDEKIKNGEEVGELFGVVVLIKDNISDKDMNTSAGAYALKDVKTKRDSFIVKKIKNQDGIILGKNNLSEWANFMSMPSSNGFSVLGGQTKNAYGKFDVGGSSSGSASSESLNFASVTLGSETAGSMIHPAGQNSVIGLKPTVGLLSRDLVIPISEAQDTVGIMGRNVSDVKKVFEHVVGFDSNDPLTVEATKFVFNDINFNNKYLQGKRLGIIDDGSSEKKALVEELKKLGAIIVNVELVGNQSEINYMPVLNYGIVHDVKAYLDNEAVITDIHSLNEVLDFNNEEPEKRMPYGAALHEDALKAELSKEEYEEIVQNNRKVASEIIDKTLEKFDVDALVSVSNELSAVYAPALYPAITVPSGYRENGEPYGVTFVGTKFDDMNLLSISYSYEVGTKHRVTPKVEK